MRLILSLYSGIFCLKFSVLYNILLTYQRGAIMICDGTSQKTHDINSFLMIGQSNMAGRGDFFEVDDIDNDMCFMLRMGRWQKMSEPINPDRAIFNAEFHSGINLCASFADNYAKQLGKKIGLIPCADGGTSISQWLPGEALFDHAIMMARLAMRTSNFGGILWHQGESDCNEENFPLYEERLIRMITSIRRELDAEELPFILGELSEEISPNWKLYDYPARINEVLLNVVKKLPNCRLVSSRGLTLKPDGIHFDSASLRELGNRYFKAYLEI